MLSIRDKQYCNIYDIFVVLYSLLESSYIYMREETFSKLIFKNKT